MEDNAFYQDIAYVQLAGEELDVKRVSSTNYALLQVYLEVLHFCGRQYDVKMLWNSYCN